MMLLTGVEIGLSIFLLGASLLAGALLKPKIKSPIQDREPTTLASRGSFIPWIVGRRRTGAVFLWVGRVRSKRSGGGKGKGFGAPAGPKTFSQTGMHAICVGPAQAIHRIWQDGKVILDETITDLTHPSGSEVQLEEGGRFRIYWGEPTQPVDALLSQPPPDGMGVASRWPFLCYALWDRKSLGLSTRWPVIDYEVEVAARAQNLVTASGVVGGGDPTTGQNPAHILDQALTAPFPHGIGLPSGLFDIAALANFAALAVSEGLACHVVVRNGDEAQSLVAALMQDCGLFAPQVNGKIRFLPVREPGTDQRILSEDVLMLPDPEIQSRPGGAKTDSLTFSFADRSLAFRDESFAINEDGQAAYSQARRGRSIRIETTVSFETAARIANRRSQEEIAGAVRYKLIANRQSRSLWPGLTAYAFGIPASLRVVSVKPDPYSGRVEVETVADFYGVVPTTFQPMSGDPPVQFQPEEDLFVLPIAFPELGPPPPPDSFRPIDVPRIRRNTAIVGADIHVSPNGVTYYYVGTSRFDATGGVLEADFPTGARHLEVGPTFEVRGPDIDQVLNLVGDAAGWRAGRQIAVIGDEILFVRSVTALGGDRFRLMGVLRGRFSTPVQSHLAGAPVLIFPADQSVQYVDPAFVDGAEIHVKTRPFTSGGAVSLADVTPVTYTIPPRRPPGPVNVRTGRINGVTNAFDPTGVLDLTVVWSYLARGTAGAGMQGAGDPVASMTPHPGSFTILVEDDGSEVLTVPNASSPHVIDAGTLLAAFGGPPPASFALRVVERIGQHEASTVITVSAY